MYKLKYILILFLFSVFVNAQEINWLTMNEALAKQKEQPKKIMIDMYTVWCGPCKMLDRNTFSNKKLAEYVNANYYAVKFNAEGDEGVDFNGQTFSNPNYDPAKAKRRNSQHQMAQYFGTRSYPTILFLGENARVGQIGSFSYGLNTSTISER